MKKVSWCHLGDTILTHFEHRFIHLLCTFRKSGWVEMKSRGVHIVNLDRRAGVVKPHTMPDTLPQVDKVVCANCAVD